MVNKDFTKATPNQKITFIEIQLNFSQPNQQKKKKLN